MQDPNTLFGRLGNRMFQMAYIYSQVVKGEIPDIYIQDPKYFDNCSKEIKSLFGSGIEKSDFVSIHVRRGDYVNNPFYVDLTKTDYYERAISLFPKREFIVFSDDPSFCKTLSWIKDNFHIVPKQDEISDFNLAAGCSDHIIANSSFSWWYAYVSPHEKKKIVAPSKERWYSDGVNRTICPDDWHRI